MQKKMIDGRKKLMVRMSKGIHCPVCRDEMRMSANHDVLRCFNPSCEMYGI